VLKNAGRTAGRRAHDAQQLIVPVLIVAVDRLAPVPAQVA
jgi:hypothetical protein